VDVFASLPPWAVVLLAVLAAVVLVALNIGWLLQAKALLDARRKRDGVTEPQRHKDTES
jgi:hypothetical protein